jgi:hypothetical protein
MGFDQKKFFWILTPFEIIGLLRFSKKVEQIYHPAQCQNTEKHHLRSKELN